MCLFPLNPSRLMDLALRLRFEVIFVECATVLFTLVAVVSIYGGEFIFRGGGCLSWMHKYTAQTLLLIRDSMRRKFLP